MVNNEVNGESGDDDDESDLDLADFAHSSEESDDNDEVAGEIFGETNAGEPINSTSVLSNEWITIANLELDTPPALHQFSSQSGPVFTPDNDAPAASYYDRFFNPVNDESLWESMMNLLVSETNNKYQVYYTRKNPVLSSRSKVHLSEPTNVRKMRAFIGILLNMGLIRKHTIEGYWNCKDYSQNTPMFRQVFKLDTFKLHLRFSHVSDSDLEPKRGDQNFDQTYKFRPVLDHFNTTWARGYQLSSGISIDESIVGFKGRHSLVNYIRIKKHHQWGPKEYNLRDAKTGYCHQTIYHTIGLKVSEHGQPFDVCDKLLANNGTHADAGTHEIERYDGSKKVVPNIVSEYNNGMGGVDLSDQMTDQYAGELRTFKCWRKIVFHLFDRTATNAYLC